MQIRALTLCLLVAVLAACASSTRQPAAIPEEIDPADPMAGTLLMQQGQALVAQGRVAEGVAKYLAALQLQPTNPTVHNLLGRAELERGNATAALAAFNRALQLAPSYSDARNNRGAAYVALGQFAAAESDFLTVLADQYYANRPGVHFNLGSLYNARGNLAAAEENLRRAAIPAGPVEAFVLLGSVEERLGKLDLAESAYRDAMLRAPERVDVAMSLAALLDRSGRRDEARALYERVVSIAPGSPEAAEATRRLGR